MWTSPWAPKIEQEDFVSETINQLDLLLHGNQDMSRLLFLFALFSPVDVELSADERAWLKHFQSKISMMVYSQLLGQEDRENRKALEIVGKVGRIIEDLYKCGQIFYQGRRRRRPSPPSTWGCMESSSWEWRVCAPAWQQQVCEQHAITTICVRALCSPCQICRAYSIRMLLVAE